MGKVIPATAPCSWGVWYADGTPSNTPYKVFLDGAAQAGYKMLELGPDGYLPTDLELLRQELDSRGLSVAAGTACYAFDQYNSFADFRDIIDKLCTRLVALDASYLVTMDDSDVGRFSEKKQDYPAQLWNKYFQMFKDLGEYTKDKYGISTVFHPHLRSLVETEDEICRMMNYTGLDLCFDIGHHAYVNQPGETSAIDFIKQHHKRVTYLHFKNVDGKVLAKVRAENLDSDAAFAMDVMGLLDEGIVDYGALKQLLDQIGFAGIGVVEQDVPNATTQQAYQMSKHNFDYLKRIGIV